MLQMRKTMLAIFESSSFNLSVILIGGLFSFLPMLTQEPSYLDTSDNVLVLTSGPLFKGASLICLALSVPLFVNVALDFGSRNLPFPTGVVPKHTKGEHSKDILTLPETTILLVGTIMLPIMSFLPIHTPNIALLAACCHRMQVIFVGGVAIASMTRFDQKYFPTKFCLPILLLLVISCAVGGYSNNYTAAHLTSTTDPLFLVTFVTVWPAAVLFMLLCLRWVIAALFVHRTRIISESNIGQEELLGDQRYTAGMLSYRLVYCCTVIGWIVIRGSLNVAIAPSFAKMLSSDTALMWTVIPYIFFQLSVLVFGLRLVKHEAVSTMYALLRSKKAYVRYISHELRTPMNTACLGLSMLRSDIEAFVQSSAPRSLAPALASAPSPHDDWLETLTDVHMACTTTVDILNDLLGFEKMESGQMILHTSSEPVLPFVGECLAMFVVHARSKGIDLTADAGDGDGSEVARGSSAGGSGEVDFGREGARESSGHTRALAASDLITIDKFKVAQVIRNLVSNAVKFTPRGGTVRIRAYVQRGGGGDDDADGDAQAPVRPHPAALLAAAIKYLGAGTGAGTNDGSGPVRVSARVQAPATVSCPVPLSVPALPLPTHPLPHTGGSAGAGAGMGTLLGPMAYSTDDIEAAPPLASSGGCGGGFLVIEVTDSGAGISKENQEKLFREVVQFNPHLLQAGGGSGLGLWISKGIVDMHGGTLAVHSEGEGCGATFTLKLPMRVEPAGPLSDPSSSAHSPRSPGPQRGADTRNDAGTDLVKDADNAPSPSPQDKEGVLDEASMCMSLSTPPAASTTLLSPRSRMPGSALLTPRHPHSSVHSALLTPRHPHAQPDPDAPQYRFLVVDDSDLNRKMVTRTLIKLGHACDEAEDGEVAIALVRAALQQQQQQEQRLDGGPPAAAAHIHMFDAILMDFVMPVVDGPTATRAIRLLGYSGKIFGITGNALQSDVDTFVTAGADAVYPKPLDTEALLGAVAVARDRRQEQQHQHRAAPPLALAGTATVTSTGTGAGTVSYMGAGVPASGDTVSRRSSKPVALPLLALPTNSDASVVPAD